MEVNKYKIIISNKNIYEEIEMPVDAKVYRVGTSIESDYRLYRDAFFEDVQLVFTNNDGKWMVMCSDNIYITLGDTKRLLTKTLEHGDVFFAKYQESNNDVFSVEFMVDFDSEIHSFERKICIQQNPFKIGTNKTNNIIINSMYATNDNIELQPCNSGYKIKIISTTYGVYKNGSKIQDGENIENMDFFSLGDISFYLKDNSLWTDISDKCIVNNVATEDHKQKKHYPLFVRNSRVQYTISNEKIGLLVAPNKPKKPDQNLAMTLLPALAMLALTIVVRGFMSNSSNNSFIIFSVCSMSMGIITSIVSFVSAKRKYKRECLERVEQYNSYIAKKRQEIELARKKEKKILEKIYFDTNTNVENISNFSLNLFDRIPTDDDFLRLYIGKGLVKAHRELDYKKPESFETNDELACIPDELTSEYKMIPDSPITIDLKKNSAVGICGKKEMNKVLFKNILIDVISRHYFGDVKLFLLIDDVQEYSWVKRIPHIYAANGMRNIVFDSESRNNVFEYLYKELTIRRSMKSCAGLPYLVVLVMNEWGIKTHPVSQFIENAKDIGVSFVFWGESKEEIPLYCGSIISIKDNNKGELIDSHKGEEKIEFSFGSISDLEMEKISQILEPIYCEEISLESSLRKSISLFELLGIYSVDDIDLIQNWNEARVWDTMAAPIGVNSKNEIVSLNLHEKFHGPHGLVAGTTGSGKSEILQTYILSAAILFHPYEVSFVIIDFKGGGMVNQFKDLPHLIGAITNIDGREINRSLKSIKAELLKRQSLFAEANVNHIDKYIQLYKNGKVKIPLPHLIIIVDEFAELKAEQPEFMKELISAARIGRSLGVHLILATQKPSGQVNEQIWSNSKFRLCLKVQNKEDSNEVLKSPLAAEIKEPGRAYLQVGNNEIFELLQSGFSGASEKANTSKEKSYIISQVDISGRKRIVYAKKKANSSKSSRTQLEAIVDYVRDTCIENGIERLQNICLPPLPSIVNIVETNKGNGMVSIGIYDDPDSQYQGDAFINISNENYMIIGSSGTGKTNFLQVIIRQIVNCYSPKQANIYIMDFGAMYLKNFQDLCYVGGVVTISEEEKLKNLFKLLVEEISARKEKFLSIGISSYSSYEEGGFEDIPRIYVLLDNYTAFREIYGDTYEEEFIYILREGLACGVNVILSNSQTSGLGYKYMSNFAGRIALHCNDSSEYSNLFDRCRMQPKDEVGRALCMMNKEIYETQMFLAFEGEKEIDRSNTIKKYVSAVNSQNEGARAKAIPEIPEVLLIDYIENNYRNCQVKYKYPVALNYEDVDLVSKDFEKINELSIVGNESSRRLDVLKSLLFSMEYYVLENTFNLYIIDDVNRQLKDFKEKMYTEEYTLDYSRIGEIIIDLEEKFEERYNSLLQNEGGEKIRMPLQIVVINSKEAIEYISSNKQILERYNKLVKQYKALGISFIYSNIEDVNVPYGAPEILKRQKENKKVLITTSKLKDFKFCELQSSVVRNMKSLEFGDAYLLDGTDISRIKILEVK